MSTPSRPFFNNQYQVFPSFTGQDGVTASAPFLLPPLGSQSAAGKSILVQLPLLKTGPVAAYTANSDFTLADGGANVNITIVGTGNVWNGAGTARTALMTNFAAFLEYVEANYELGQSPSLVPGATFKIGQALADAVPAPLLETLFYRYSLSTGFLPSVNAGVPQAFVDVRPGMRLRVDAEGFQYVVPNAKQNGYVPAGRLELRVGATATGGGARVVTFDPFMGTIASPAITQGTANPATAGGLFDLQFANLARNYVRLFYPGSVAAPAQPGSVTNQNNVALVGAQTLGMLNQGTLNYPAAWTVSPVMAPANQQNVCSIFTGRAVVAPEIPIFISGRGQVWNEYVPVGTTLANIVERYLLLPASGSMPPGSQLVLLSRNTSAFPGNPTPTLVPVDTYGTGNSVTPPLPAFMFDVPLIAGDSIVLNF